jgi:flagellar secretion chaperone FliS
VMLYDGAIRFLERALTGFRHDDPLEFNRTINNNILRAQEIITELNNSLDLGQGGELALTLRRLYNFMHRQLTHSNLRKTPEGINDTIQRLTVLRDAWSEMLRRQEAEAPAQLPFEALAATS